MRIPTYLTAAISAAILATATPAMAQSSPTEIATSYLDDVVNDLAAIQGAATTGAKLLDRAVPNGVMAGHLDVDQTLKANNINIGQNSSIVANTLRLSDGTTIGWANIDQNAKLNGVWLADNASVDVNNIHIIDSMLPHLSIDQSAKINGLAVARRGQFVGNSVLLGR